MNQVKRSVAIIEVKQELKATNEQCRELVPLYENATLEFLASIGELDSEIGFEVNPGRVGALLVEVQSEWLNDSAVASEIAKRLKQVETQFLTVIK